MALAAKTLACQEMTRRPLRRSAMVKSKAWGFVVGIAAGAACLVACGDDAANPYRSPEPCGTGGAGQCRDGKAPGSGGIAGAGGAQVDAGSGGAREAGPPDA